MAKSNLMTTIAIDTDRSVIHFYSMTGSDKDSITHNIKSYAGAAFTETFFEKFKEAVKDYVENTPSESIRKITVVLPDSAVLTDMVKVPTVKGSAQMQKMLDVTLSNLYSNYKDLHIVAQMADQNKQFSVIGITAVQNAIVSAIYSACSENKLLVDTLTFASASTVAGASLFNNKLRNTSYLLLDIKDVCSKFVFVVDGKAVGFYTLPFGLEFLRNPRVLREAMLFDHSYAELVVLNAQERARSKKLTVMAFGESSSRAKNDNSLEEEKMAAMGMRPAEDQQLPDGEVDGEVDGEADVAETAGEGSEQKTTVRKSPRDLPRFTYQEDAETDTETVSANFRVFVKWALNLILSNEKITALDKPQSVCVNLPEDLSYLIETTNQESAENGIPFTRLPSTGETYLVSENLELYGGLFPGQINSANKL